MPWSVRDLPGVTSSDAVTAARGKSSPRTPPPCQRQTDTRGLSWGTVGPCGPEPTSHLLAFPRLAMGRQALCPFPATGLFTDSSVHLYPVWPVTTPSPQLGQRQERGSHVPAPDLPTRRAWQMRRASSTLTQTCTGHGSTGHRATPRGGHLSRLSLGDWGHHHTPAPAGASILGK